MTPEQIKLLVRQTIPPGITPNIMALQIVMTSPTMADIKCRTMNGEWYAALLKIEQ